MEKFGFHTPQRNPRHGTFDEQIKEYPTNHVDHRSSFNRKKIVFYAIPLPFSLSIQ